MVYRDEGVALTGTVTHKGSLQQGQQPKGRAFHRDRRICLMLRHAKLG